MSDPVWRARVNISLNKLDELVNIATILKELVANHGVQINGLAGQIKELQEKVKESRKRPKKARSRKHPVDGMCRGKKS